MRQNDQKKGPINLDEIFFIFQSEIADTTQLVMFNYCGLKRQILGGYSLRKLRVSDEGILGSVNDALAKRHSHMGEPSISVERLLHASSTQVFFLIRSECQQVQYIEYNLLWRWFVDG